MALRSSVFSGSWYPDSPGACEKQIKAFLAEELYATAGEGHRIGGIVPHAGWYFSGSIACNVIYRLQQGPAPDVVIVYGMHLHPGSPRAIMSAGQWETPFGPLTIAADLAAALTVRCDFPVDDPHAFDRDNTIELQTPFIKYFFDKAQLLPLGVPPTADTLALAATLAECIQAKGLTVRVLGSTDLTHYGDNYGFAPKGRGPGAVDWVKTQNDRLVIEAMLAMDPQAVIDQGLSRHNACCAGAAAAALATGACLGAGAPKRLAYATSHDKSPGDSFVGYVGIVF